MDRKTFYKVSYFLVLLGGINWGLLGLLKINLVTTVFGGTGLEDFIYVVVGAAALYLLINKAKK